MQSISGGPVVLTTTPIDQVIVKFDKNSDSEEIDLTTDKVKQAAEVCFEKQNIRNLSPNTLQNEISYINQFNVRDRLDHIRFSVRQKIQSQDFEAAIELIQSTLHPSYMRLDPDRLGVEGDPATQLLLDLFQEWIKCEGVVYVTLKAEEMSSEGEDEITVLPYYLGDIAKMAAAYYYMDELDDEELELMPSSFPIPMPEMALVCTEKMEQSVFKNAALLTIATHYLKNREFESAVNVIKESSSSVYQYEIYQHLEDERKTMNMHEINRIRIMDQVFEGLSLYHLRTNYAKAWIMAKKIFSMEKRDNIINRLIDEAEYFEATSSEDSEVSYVQKENLEKSNEGSSFEKITF